MSLTLEHLTVTLHDRPIAALDLTVGAGEILTLMAPSGAGKSSVLVAIIGTLGPPFTLSGRVLLNGRDVTTLPTRSRRIGLLFQDDLLFPHLSVAGNLGFALPAKAPDRATRIDAALASVNLAGFGHRDPATLSGGERARVALMRCLLAEPQALLLDEPFSRLDAALRDQMRALVFGQARALGLPTILVTHDADDARAAAGRILDPFGQPSPPATRSKD